MFRKIVAAFLCTLLFIGVLAAGGLTIKEFGRRIEFKNPVTVFQPLVQKLGINFNFNVGSDSGGSLLVNAEDKDNESGGDDSPGASGGSDVVENPGNEKPENPSMPELPTIPKPADPDVPRTVTVKQLNTLISSIRVADDKNLKTDYDRTLFESPSKSYELNGKKYSRNEYAWRTSPYLISENPFKYKCPYTGSIIEDKSKLDYDHIIPLNYVYQRVDWEKAKCNEYAYAQSVGVDVSYSANRSKGSKGPSEWLPSVNVENYCYTWLRIAQEWDIPLSKADIEMCKLYCLNAINSGQTLERID